MDKTDSAQDSRWMKWCKGICLGGIAGLLTAMVLLLILSAAISSGIMETAGEGSAILAISSAAAAAGVFLAARLTGLKGLLAGVCIGVCLILLRLLTGLLMSGELSPDAGILPSLAASVLGGGAAGFCFQGSRKAKRKKRVSRR